MVLNHRDLFFWHLDMMKRSVTLHLRYTDSILFKRSYCISSLSYHLPIYLPLCFSFFLILSLNLFHYLSFFLFLFFLLLSFPVAIFLPPLSDSLSFSLSLHPSHSMHGRPFFTKIKWYYLSRNNLNGMEIQ